MKKSSAHLFKKEVLGRKNTVGKREVIPVAIHFGLGGYMKDVLLRISQFVDPHQRLEAGALTQHRPGSDLSFKCERQTRAHAVSRDDRWEPQSWNECIAVRITALWLKQN